MSTVEDLRYALAEYHRAHGEAENSYRYWSELHKANKDRRAELLTKVTDERDGNGKPAYSNAERRELEVQRRMETDYAADLEEYQDAERRKRTTAANLERAHETLKTLRALLLYETAELDYQTTQLAARRLLPDEVPF